MHDYCAACRLEILDDYVFAKGPLYGVSRRLGYKAWHRLQHLHRAATGRWMKVGRFLHRRCFLRELRYEQLRRTPLPGRVHVVQDGICLVCKARDGNRRRP